MKITKNLLTKNDCYKAGRTIKPTGIVVHSTGCNQTKASVFMNSWNKANVSKCVHAFVETDAIYQTLPWNYRCWGCGSGSKGSYNNSHIQFEICEDGLKDKKYFDKVYNQSVELCAYLCKEHNIPVSAITCHADAHKAGYASNHADVNHWFPKYGKSMDTFRTDVANKIKENSKPATYIVVVDTDVLNVREKPSADSKATTQIKRGQAYTIVEEQNGWGKLKSGAGWISLKYTKKK